MANIRRAGGAIVPVSSGSRQPPIASRRTVEPVGPVVSTEVMTTEDHRSYFLSIEGALLKFGSLVLLPFRWEFGRDRSTKTTVVKWSFLGAVALGMFLAGVVAYQLWRPLSHLPSWWRTEAESDAGAAPPQSMAKKIKPRAAPKPPEARDVTRDNLGR
jgi:hypothetical protein